MNNINCSGRPINLRNMRNATPQMSCYNSLDMENLNSKNIDDMPIAMAYVPYQQWRNIYEPNEAFRRGTIFKELDLPFTCARGCK